MVDIDKKLMAYFRELSPRDRRIMFENLVAEGVVDDEVKEFCERLYNDRYTDKRKPERRVDNWIYKFVYMPGLYSKRRIFRGAMNREATAVLQDLHLDYAESMNEMEQTLLYLEFRNAAKRYLSTCSNPQYGTRFFGLRPISDDEKKQKACEEIWIIARGMPIAFGEEERMKLWSNALYDELMQYDESLKPYYEALEEGGGKLK